MSAPRFFLLAGPNGAGKTTQAHQILAEDGVGIYLNLDFLAGGLNMFKPRPMLRRAALTLLARSDELQQEREDFAQETNLSGRRVLERFEGARAAGYDLHVRFLALRSVEHAQARVARRVAMGGHLIDPNMIRERFHAGLAAFFGRFRDMARTWRFFESVEASSWGDFVRGESVFHLVAEGGQEREAQIFAPEAWELFQALAREASHAR